MTDVVPAACILCESDGGEILWADERCRVILIDDADYPGFCRVVWYRHAAEMTDLSDAERSHLMTVVFACEQVLRAVLRPLKINLASLGNITPHLHWHVIPRYRTDRSFPDPVWSPPRRASQPAMPVDSQHLQTALNSLLGTPTRARSRPDSGN